MLGDQAYGNDAKLRTRLHAEGIDYVLSVGPECDVYEPDTVFAVPPRRPGSRGLAPVRCHRDRAAVDRAVARRASTRTPCRRSRSATATAEQIVSRFAFVRVIAAHPVDRDRQAPREEWLIIEWPEGHEQPSDYWISNLPAATEPERLARLARLRWMIELDYKQLKGELGLDHYEGRSYAGFHHHSTLVTAAHGFLTLERADPNHPRPG